MDYRPYRRTSHALSHLYHDIQLEPVHYGVSCAYELGILGLCYKFALSFFSKCFHYHYFYYVITIIITITLIIPMYNNNNNNNNKNNINKMIIFIIIIIIITAYLYATR